jgi:hypothetical protein
MNMLSLEDQGLQLLRWIFNTLIQRFPKKNLRYRSIYSFLSVGPELKIDINWYKKSIIIVSDL